MNWNALDWNAHIDDTPAFAELVAVLTPAALDGAAELVRPALAAIDALDLDQFTCEEQSALRGLIGDVRASHARLRYAAAHPVKKKSARPQRHHRPRLAI